MSNISRERYLSKTKKIKITEKKKLMLNKNAYLSPEIGETTNSAYGVAYQLKKFAGINPEIPFNCTIEHGMSLRKMVCQLEVKHHVSHILTFSPFRERIIKELTDIIPVAIGPYIAYAEDYSSKEYVDKLKKKYGKILLAIPSHSIPGIDADYDINQFIEKIDQTRKGFDTVMVCLYWTDLQKGLWKPYEKKKYCVVSAGYYTDPCFLSRLKQILFLSDAVITNAYTTGLAYALYMNKPIRIVEQSVQFNSTGCNNSYELSVEDQIDKVYGLFCDADFVITEEQRKFGDYIFGLENVKSREELQQLLIPLLRVYGEKKII